MKNDRFRLPKLPTPILYRVIFKTITSRLIKSRSYIDRPAFSTNETHSHKHLIPPTINTSKLLKGKTSPQYYKAKATDLKVPLKLTHKLTETLPSHVNGIMAS